MRPTRSVNGREARVEVGGDCAHADLVVNGFPAAWSGLPAASRGRGG